MTTKQKDTKTETQSEQADPKGPDFTGEGGERHYVITLVEQAIRAKHGDETFDAMTAEQRRDAWLEISREATKTVRADARDADMDEAKANALAMVRAALAEAVTKANAALADVKRTITAGSIRFTSNAEDGGIVWAERPAYPLTLRRVSEPENESDNGSEAESE